MNYRHSFHAGNSADVVKHSLLIALIRALQRKQGPLTLIDTHAGCGLYDLQSEEAARGALPEDHAPVAPNCRHPRPLSHPQRATPERLPVPPPL